jgi:hypothetical protein
MPVALPIPVVPEVPLKETWQFKTVVNIAHAGKEQRTATRSNPRMVLQFNALILDGTDYERARATLIGYQGRSFYYPLYQYATSLTAKSIASTSKLFFNPANSDIRAGEAVAIFNPAVCTTTMYMVASIDIDGCTLTTPLLQEIPTHFKVCPALECRIDTDATLRMQATSGELSLQLISLANRNPVRLNSSATLTLLDGLPLIDKRPLADNSVGSSFDKSTQWLDIGSNRPAPHSNYFMPYISLTASYLINNEIDMDYWRLLASELNGQQKSFLLPTFRNDLPLTQIPAIGATQIRSSNVQFFDYWQSATHKFVRWQSNAETGYAEITNVILNNDANGNPETIDVTLASPITSVAGLVISFVNTCRLNSDNVSFEHFGINSTVNLSVRTVDQ